MKLIIAFIKPFKLDEVGDALKEAGVSGMSVGDISGFGRQSGQTEVYRGAEYEVDFVPKVRLEILVPDELTGPAVSAIETVSVEDVVRIRTGERGTDAV
jgi:nitrogen regulatory protein PII